MQRQTYGYETAELLESECNIHLNSITEILKNWNGIDTLQKWHNIVFSIEEFTNIFSTELEYEEEFDSFLETKIDDFLLHFDSSLKKKLRERYDKDVYERFLNLMLLSIDFNRALEMTGSTHHLTTNNNLDTIGNAVRYYQSRRKYFVTILYLIPKLSIGNIIKDRTEIFMNLLSITELNCVALSTVNNLILLNKVYPDFKLNINNDAFSGNYDYQYLDDFFIEPERLSLPEQMQMLDDITSFKSSYKRKVNRVFSIGELKESLDLIEYAYSEYKIASTDFTFFKKVILSILSYSSYSDYFIRVSESEFSSLVNSFSKREKELFNKCFMNKSDNYFDNLNSSHSLLKIDNYYITNVNLLMRNLYYLKNKILYQNKRFQIKTGFKFEKLVKRKLENYGFRVTDITRINRKEFDVVTIKDGVIHNFQCKNNFIDITNLALNHKKFIRYNKKLNRYYEKALQKEENREELLKNKLNIYNIEHYVISKFPIITNNPKIILFNEL